MQLEDKQLDLLTSTFPLKSMISTTVSLCSHSAGTNSVLLDFCGDSSLVELLLIHHSGV